MAIHNIKSGAVTLYPFLMMATVIFCYSRGFAILFSTNKRSKGTGVVIKVFSLCRGATAVCAQNTRNENRADTSVCPYGKP